jgi:hypothetical protein
VYAAELVTNNCDDSPIKAVNDLGSPRYDLFTVHSANDFCDGNMEFDEGAAFIHHYL